MGKLLWWKWNPEIGKGRQILVDWVKVDNTCCSFLHHSFVQFLLSGYSPAELIQCLCELTLEARELIHIDTANVDLSRDAKLLR